MPDDTTSYQMFFEIIPHILRDDELRPHLRGLFDWYRKLDAWALERRRRGSRRPHIEPLALLTVAIADGIALQVHADPDLDFEPGVRPLAPARAGVRRVEAAGRAGSRGGDSGGGPD